MTKLSHRPRHPHSWRLSAVAGILVAVAAPAVAAPDTTYEAPRANEAPSIDGDPGDASWANASWRPMDKLMLGEMPAPEDFSGAYKVVWTRDHLYLLARITDDVLLDVHADPLDRYWEDDTLEIFIDEDASGGDHQYSYNAFAYHIALDNQAVDTGPFRSTEDEAAGNQFMLTLPDHIHARWRRSPDEPHDLYWEVRISVYGDDFRDRYAPGETQARPVTLAAGKTLGFMVAWCDADLPGDGREHFVGDVEIEPVDGDRNRGWIDAGVFGRLVLSRD